MNIQKKPAPDPMPDLPRYVPVPPAGNGHKVQPDRNTKIMLGGGYALIMLVAGFLALQVWMMNGRQERQDERLTAFQESQREWNARFERGLDKLTDEFRAFKDEMLKRIGGGK